jgi:hypothetical protein
MAPLTGFFGTNSSGKIAILQFLLMLKQTVESSDRQRILHLGGDRDSYVDLGTNYDISHKHRLPEKIEFSLNWNPKFINQLSLLFPAETLEYLTATNSSESTLRFESEINIASDRINVGFFRYLFMGQDRQWRAIKIISSESEQQELIYKLSIEEGIPSPDRDNFDCECNIPSEYVRPMKNYRLQPLPRMSFTDCFTAYEDLFQNTYYLGPLREYPKRTYLWSGESPQDVGIR